MNHPCITTDHPVQMGQLKTWKSLRACLKRGDDRGWERVHLGYEKQPVVSNRSHRPSVGLYQRFDPHRKARGAPTNIGHAKDRQCDPVFDSDRVSMANATA